MLWVILIWTLVSPLLILGAIWVLLVTHNRDWLSRFVEHEHAVNDHFKDLRQEVARLSTSLSARPLPSLPETPWMGVVLPTDEVNAEVERRLRTAEDHAMSASELRPGSLPPSRPSGRTSSGTSSTRRDRSSGRA